MEKWTYEKAGVSVKAGYEAVKRMKTHAEKTKIPGVLEGLGSFGGLFELPVGYKNPVLVSGTDSVGSKVQIAFETDRHNTIGIDCVAMCVNDIICMGAKPLYFLDYIGIGGLDPHKAEMLVEGVSNGCVQAGCALIGGETCEMPDIYKPGEYDLVGFAVGIVEKDAIITGNDIQIGDAVIGIESSGLHSNGYTLVRKIVEEQNLHHNQYIEQLGKTLGEELLTPTKIYAKLIEKLTETYKIKGMANITGGGWIENMPRMIPANPAANSSQATPTDIKISVSKGKAPVPEIFKLVQKWGNVDESEMYGTFNMGIGFVVCVDESDASAVLETINNADEKAYIIGKIEKRFEGEKEIVII